MGVQPPQGPAEYSFKPLPSAFICARAPTYLCIKLLDCRKWKNADGSEYLHNRLVINLTQGVGFFGGMVALPITVCLSPVTAAIDVITGVTESAFYLCKGYTMVARTMAYNKIVVSPSQHLWFCLAIIKSFGLMFAASSVFLLGISCQVIPAFVVSAIFASAFWFVWYQLGIETVIGLPEFINPNTFNILGRTKAIPEPAPRVPTPPPEEQPRQATPPPQPEPEPRSERANASTNTSQRAQANSSRRVPTKSEQIRREAERIWDNNFQYSWKRSIYSFLHEYSRGVDSHWKSILSHKIMKVRQDFFIYYQNIDSYVSSSSFSENDRGLFHNFVIQSRRLMEQMRRNDPIAPLDSPLLLLGLPKNFTYVDIKNRYLDLACILLNVEDESKRQAQVCLMNLLIYSVQVILSQGERYESLPRRGEDILKDWNRLVRRIINSGLDPLERRNYFADITLEMFRNRARMLFRKEVSWLDLQPASLFEKVDALRELFELPVFYTLNELRRNSMRYQDAFNRESSKEKQRVKFLLLDIFAYADIVLTKYARLRAEHYDSSSSSDEEEKAPPPRQEQASRQQALLPFEVRNKLIEWNNFFQSNLELAAALSLSQAANNAVYQGFKVGVVLLYNARRGVNSIDPGEEFERIRNLFGLPSDYTQQDLKKKYRKLQVVLHPDKNPDAQDEATFLWKVFQLTHPVLVENQKHSPMEAG